MPAVLDRPAPRFGHARIALRGGVAAAALAFLATGPALAQTPPVVSSSTPAQQAGPDGLRPGGLYLEADSLEGQDDSQVLTATGSVQARYEARTLRAQTLIYNRGTGLVTARGNAQIINSDGSVQYADTVELDQDLRAGVATNFATRMPDGVKIAAATAVRRSETVNELNRAIFTPCPICAEDPTPTWSIQADRIVQDQDNQVILYRDAVIRVGGVPVFYSPFFAHPDPSAERASGFLIPRVSISDRRGFSYEQPYLWVISPSEDLIVSPQVNTRVNPFLNLEHRRRFWSGIVESRLGYTYERELGDFDANADGIIQDSEEDRRYGEARSRSFILARGAFDLGEDWRWGFSAERTNDKNLFDRYDISDVYEDRGLYVTDSRRLISQLTVERQTRRSYLSVAMVSFQSLRVVGLTVPTAGVSLPRANVFEDDGVLPLVAPLIEARWEPAGAVLGGRLRLHGNAVVLTRDDYVGYPTLPLGFVPVGPTAGLPGVDSRRATGDLDWRRIITTGGGVRLEPFVTARADAYSVSELSLGSEDVSVTRFNATLGLDVRYPLIRRFRSGASLVIEPMAQLAVSPDPDLDPRLPNEDSQVVEFDETNLFDDSKFPGYDLYEGGVRLSLGARAEARWGQGRSASLFVGRQFRAEEEPGYLRPVNGAPGQFYDPTGIAETASDWLIAATFVPFSRVSGQVRARIDGDTAEVRRMDASVVASFGLKNFAAISYGVDDTDPSPLTTNGNYEYLQGSGQFFFTRHWGVSGLAVRDQRRDALIRSELALVYDDECLRFELVYEREERLAPIGTSSALGLRPSEGVFIRLNLATLGDTGYGRTDTR